MDHRRDVLGQLCGASLIPQVTLHYPRNPVWFEDAGAFLNPNRTKVSGITSATRADGVSVGVCR